MSVTTTTTDLWRLSATDLAEAIRSNQASSREVAAVEDSIGIITPIDPK